MIQIHLLVKEDFGLLDRADWNELFQHIAVLVRKAEDPERAVRIEELKALLEPKVLNVPYYLVTASMDELGGLGDMQVRSFASPQMLAGATREAREKAIASGEDTRAAFFRGERFFISRGPRKYLLIDDQQFPLFDKADDVTPDEDGRLCNDATGTTLPR